MAQSKKKGAPLAPAAIKSSVVPTSPAVPTSLLLSPSEAREGREIWQAAVRVLRTRNKEEEVEAN